MVTPAQVGGGRVRGQVCPLPGRGEIEQHLMKSVPGITRSLAQRAANTAFGCPGDRLAEAERIARDRLAARASNSDRSLAGRLGYADPTGNTAAANLDRRCA